MKCDKCGTENLTIARFCENCGDTLENGEKKVVAKNLKQGRGLAIALSSGMMVALVVIAVLIMRGGSEEKKGFDDYNDDDTVVAMSGEIDGSDNSTGEINVGTDVIGKGEEAADTSEDVPAETPDEPAQEQGGEEADSINVSELRDQFVQIAKEIDDYAYFGFKRAGSQEDMINLTGEICEAWEALLGDVCACLQMVMDEEEFAAFKENEMAWQEKKTIDIENAMRKSNSEGDAIIAGNKTAIKCNQKRFYEIIKLLK